VTARKRGERADRGSRRDDPAGGKARVRAGPTERQPTLYGSVLAAVFLGVGALFLVLAAFGRGWPFLLGAIDFLVIGAVLYWVATRS
jgi:hypothetical protein